MYPATIRRVALATGIATLASSPSQAVTYAVPSVVVAALYDSNVFIRPNAREEDLVTRISPSLEVGHETRRSAARLTYSQDAERYENYPELDSDRMRSSLTASVLLELDERLAMSLDAGQSESRVLVDLNTATGAGEGRGSGTRSYVAPAVAYRFGPRLTALVEANITRDEQEDGLQTDTDDGNVQFEHVINRNNQLLYSYRYRRFRFDGGLERDVHEPSVGVIHRLGVNTTVTAMAGPRISDGDDDTRIQGLLSIDHSFSDGSLSVSWERDSTTLIGEAAVVELDVMQALLGWDVTPETRLAFQVGFASLTGRVQGKTDVYRAGLEAERRLTDSISIIASWDYSHQSSTGVAGDFSIPRHVALLSVQFQLPRSSEPRPRLLPTARSRIQ